MQSTNGMSEYSNLMLVDIIHGNSAKYTQDDVLAAELELSGRNLSEEEINRLKSKVNYISGINMGPNSTTSSSSSYSEESNTEEDDDTESKGALEGSDSIMVNVLIGYLALTSIGSLFGAFSGYFISQLISVGVLGVGVYGIYGLLNRESFPVILLIGMFAMNLSRSLISALGLVVSFNLPLALISLIFVAIGAFILYFLTKESIRRAYNLDMDDIKKAIGIGVLLSFLLKFL